MGRHTSTQKLRDALTFGGSQVQLMKVARILLPRVLSDQMSVTQETSKDIASWLGATYLPVGATSEDFGEIPMPAARSVLSSRPNV